MGRFLQWRKPSIMVHFLNSWPSSMLSIQVTLAWGSCVAGLTNRWVPSPCISMGSQNVSSEQGRAGRYLDQSLLTTGDNIYSISGQGITYTSTYVHYFPTSRMMYPRPMSIHIWKLSQDINLCSISISKKFSDDTDSSRLDPHIEDYWSILELCLHLHPLLINSASQTRPY